METFKLTYEIRNKSEIKLFDPHFVKNNIRKSKMIIENKMLSLTDKYKVHNTNKKYLKVKLLLFTENIFNFEKMFFKSNLLKQFSIGLKENKERPKLGEPTDEEKDKHKINQDIDDDNEYYNLYSIEKTEEQKNIVYSEFNSFQKFINISTIHKEYNFDTDIDIYKELYKTILTYIRKKKRKIMVSNLSNMFNGCHSLAYLPDLSFNTKYTYDMSYMFNGCYSLAYLPDLSWNTKNVKNMGYMFAGCTKLLFLPDISNWNLSNVKSIEKMFSKCSSLKSLPDLSKWNISNIEDICYLFNECISLSSLPNISNWKTDKVTNLDFMFNKCSSLLSLPKLSKWNTRNIVKMNKIFGGCSSLLILPDISKWKTKNVKYMSYMFTGCSSLTSLPDISIWDIRNVTDIEYMFSECSSLISLPDISKWDAYNLEFIDHLFDKCSSLISIPDITKWNTSNVKTISEMFGYCTSLFYLPNIFKWSFSSNFENSYIFKNSIINLPDEFKYFKIYRIKDKNRKSKIFNEKFVKENKNNYFFIYNNKIFPFQENFPVNNIEYEKEKESDVLLIELENLNVISQIINKEYISIEEFSTLNDKRNEEKVDIVTLNYKLYLISNKGDIKSNK